MQLLSYWQLGCVSFFLKQYRSPALGHQNNFMHKNHDVKGREFLERKGPFENFIIKSQKSHFWGLHEKHSLFLCNINLCKPRSLKRWKDAKILTKIKMLICSLAFFKIIYSYIYIYIYFFSFFNTWIREAQKRVFVQTAICKRQNLNVYIAQKLHVEWMIKFPNLCQLKVIKNAYMEKWKVNLVAYLLRS